MDGTIVKKSTPYIFPLMRHTVVVCINRMIAMAIGCFICVNNSFVIVLIGFVMSGGVLYKILVWGFNKTIFIFYCSGLLLHLITLSDTNARTHVRAHAHTHSVGLLWTRVRSVAETDSMPAIPAGERLQTHALDSAANRIGTLFW
jgi:hypothetical protein